MNQVRKAERLLLLSLILAGLLFLLVISFYGSVFATNDDYRMRQIVSGDYTGTPEAEAVFMRYPAAVFLSALYRMTDSVPWYGLCMLACLLVPCVLFFYHILEHGVRLGHPIGAAGLCGILFLFSVQKHVMLPQFTLAAAFPVCGALVLLWRIPDTKHPVPHIIGCIVMCTISAVIRTKVFMMLCPFLMLAVLCRLLSPDCQHRVKSVVLKRILPCVILCVCLCTAMVKIASPDPLSDSYRAFNLARSDVYDYGTIAPFETNQAAYQAAGITRGMYYAVTARYLDMVPEIDADVLSAAARLSAGHDAPAAERLADAVPALFSQFLESSVIYQMLFAGVGLLVLLCVSVLRGRADITTVLIASAAGVLAEMGYFCFIGRVMDRLTDVLLLALCSMLVAVGPDLFFSGTARKTRRRKSAAVTLRNTVLVICAAACLGCVLVGNQSRLAVRAESQRQINQRLSVLNAYASGSPDMFYFYDAYDFIACSDSVFSSGSGMCNTDSLGNWYARSEDYFDRNEKYGFTHASEGLASGKAVYAAIGPLKQGILYTMQEQYGMEPQRYASIPYGNNNINLYRMMPIGRAGR